MCPLCMKAPLRLWLVEVTVQPEKRERKTRVFRYVVMEVSGEAAISLIRNGEREYVHQDTDAYEAFNHNEPTPVVSIGLVFR